MTKWILLAAGVFLTFNGTMSRTYGFENPPEYCWNMDYIRLYGCTASPVWPQVVVWGATLAGAALILGCIVYGGRKSA